MLLVLQLKSSSSFSVFTQAGVFHVVRTVIRHLASSDMPHTVSLIQSFHTRYSDETRWSRSDLCLLTQFPGFVISKIMPASIHIVCLSSCCLIGLTFAVCKYVFRCLLPFAATCSKVYFLCASSAANAQLTFSGLAGQALHAQLRCKTHRLSVVIAAQCCYFYTLGWRNLSVKCT